MTSDDQKDREWVRQFRAGDVLAFERLVKRHQDRIYRLALLWLYDDQLALDATQEVFLRAHNGLRSFRFRSSVFTWLYRTARNVCSEKNRRHALPAVAVEIIDDRPGPESTASAKQSTQRLHQLVAELPHRQREVIVLRILEGFSTRDTASIMGCAEGTVKALMSKGTARLKLICEARGLQW